jgi:peptide/nickel transport system ATP-binding protein
MSLISLNQTSKRYGSDPRAPLALKPASLSISQGETVACIGESGSGKSTLGRLIAGIEKPTSGTIEVASEHRGTGRSLWRHGSLGLVFQDPLASLPPKMTITQALEEPLIVMGDTATAERRDRVRNALEGVGLAPSLAGRYPRELSGGQRQRVCIARALISSPALLLADEPVASLDVSVQSQVLNLLVEVQERVGFAMFFVTHDLRVARYIADRMIVVRSGEIVEEGAVEDIVSNPRDPYTAELLAELPG